ncbi:MAG: hypothetical protein DHS20C18_39960 [Saprospiraceae bacterium]|nr:MAG: hypothetical protein DHS20C18_39960 [Saprospiraceae bacterium]
MKWTSTLFAIIGLLWAGIANAQVSCEYTLELSDTFGDGWNGSSLTVTANGEDQVYTLNNVDDDGYFRAFSIIVTEGAQYNLNYQPGAFENEVSYILYDAEGNIVFQDGTNPTTGDVFTDVLNCPECPPPPLGGIFVEDIRAFSARVNWLYSDPNGTYFLEYGEAGFVPGTGTIIQTTNDTRVLSGLTENTAYEFNLSVMCANGDSLTADSVFSFMTPYANDVGVVGISMPQSGCSMGLGNQMVEVTLANFGGAPQSLIPFNFSINGVPAGVNQPLDGVYTGVLGTDSIDMIEFDMNYDFSIPGEYEIVAWTELETDSVLTNDTFTVTIFSIPTIDEIPNYNNFESGQVGWRLSPENSDNFTFAFGEPNGNIISNAASGQNAWVTNLNGVYNPSEFGYILSPCLDFSAYTEDPIFDFALNLFSEDTYDGMWLEMSIDNGETWEKVGTSLPGDEGINWYNLDDDLYSHWWSGDQIYNGWVIASHVLDGAAGNDEVQLRFGFASDGSVQQEGIGVDNIYIHGAIDQDLSCVTAIRTSAEPCGSETDQIQVSIFNHGETPLSDFTMNFQVNGGPVISEVANITVNPGEQVLYSFVTPFNSLGLTAFNALIWGDFGDDFIGNDSTSLFYSSLNALPLAEDFETGSFPGGWTTDEFDPIIFPLGHNNETFIISDNIYSGDPNFEVTTAAYGPVEPGTNLAFDYRFVDYFDGIVATILGPGDSLEIQVSPFCELNFTTIYTINMDNHVPTTDFTRLVLDLSDYAGEGILVRWFGSWGQGDYWMDLDNINMGTCPESLDLETSVLNEWPEGSSNGSITINPGTGQTPFYYEWSNGETTATIDSLINGNYAVTVSDANGCSEVTNVVVELAVGTEDINPIGDISLAPNPTSGLVDLKVSFNEAVDAQVQVVNTLGQVLFKATENRVREAQYQLDLSRYSDGLYLVQIVADGQVKTKKLIKSK